MDTQPEPDQDVRAETDEAFPVAPDEEPADVTEIADRVQRM